MDFALALTAPEEGAVLVLIACLAAPIAAVAFARSGPAWRSIGRGPLSIDRQEPGERDPCGPDGAVEPGSEAAELRSEVRQLVLAGNERRRRLGLEPLDVDAETERRLSDAQGSPGIS